MTVMLVMGKCGQASMVRRIVPANLQLVGGRQPVITIPFQHIPVPLFSEPEIGAILKIQDEPEGLTVKVEWDDPLDFGTKSLLDFQQPLSCSHRQWPSRRGPAGQYLGGPACPE